MTRRLARHAYALAVLALTAAVLLTGGIVLFGIVLPQITAANLPATASPSTGGTGAVLVSPSVTPSASGTMRGVVLPANADCSACHITAGGTIGLRPIPPMGHPLEGWTQCTSCHAPAGLVKTAPGHSGIHATDCLTCHKPGNLPAPLSRPHRDRQNLDCLACHGTKAPLPADMTHRSQTVCWLCHRLPEEQPPVPAHPTVSGQTDCLSCHVAAKVGALPPDHTSRSASECLLCHQLPAADPPAPVRSEAP